VSITEKGNAMANRVRSRLVEAFSAGRRLVILPVDHGLALGEVEGLEDPVGVGLRFLGSTDIDGVLCSLSVGRRLKGKGMSDGSLVIGTLDSALQGGDGNIKQVMVSSASAATELGCDGVKVLMAWAEPLENRAETLGLVAAAVNESHAEGLPVIVEPVAAGAIQFTAIEELERRELEAARIAIELGADVIKMRIWQTERFEAFVGACPVPVVALGGGLAGGLSGVVDLVRYAMTVGLRGVFVGRNIWQRPEAEALSLMKEVCRIVHSNNDTDHRSESEEE